MPRFFYCHFVTASCDSLRLSPRKKESIKLHACHDCNPKLVKTNWKELCPNEASLSVAGLFPFLRTCALFCMFSAMILSDGSGENAQEIRLGDKTFVKVLES